MNKDIQNILLAASARKLVRLLPCLLYRFRRQ